MHIEITPFTSVMRLYDRPDGYKNRLPYRASLIVQWMNSTEVQLSVAMGEIGPQVWTLAMDALRECGIKKVTFERRGQARTYDI
jgi:hypothetical protein